MEIRRDNIEEFKKLLQPFLAKNLGVVAGILGILMPR